MDRTDNTDLIEAYLNNTLPEIERKEVENRLETDPDFRKEVRLQKYLRSQLSDPEQWKHYDRLAVARKKPALSFLNYNYLKLVLLSVGILIAIFYIWDQHYNGQKTSFVPPSSKTISPEKGMLPEGQLPVIKPEPPKKENTPNPILPASKRPIAKADDIDYATNASMEDNLDGDRGGDFQTTIESPQKNAIFQLAPNSQVTIVFKGSVNGILTNDKYDFSLLIYNNRDNKHPIFSQPITMVRKSKDTLSFNLREHIELKAGLYYFTIVQDENGEEIYIGKFNVEKR